MTYRKLALSGLCWVLLFGFAGSAFAQSTKQRLSNLEQKVVRLEGQLQNNQSVQTDLLQRLQQLRKENQELRNQLETLQFESTRSADRQRQLYIDLDQRLQALESSGSGAAGAGSPGAMATDKEAYEAAFAHLKEGSYEKAGTDFAAFLQDYPDSELRDNAQYWLAETLYVRKDFNAALAGFQQVISTYPASRKLPDAWLKIGYCNYELQNWDAARKALSTLSMQYPETTAAKLGKERLALLDSEGR